MKSYVQKNIKRILIIITIICIIVSTAFVLIYRPQIEVLPETGGVGSLVSPMSPGYTINWRFNEWHNGVLHKGFDFFYGDGVIYSAGTGTVEKFDYGDNQGLGHVVVIKHSSNLYTVYAHLDEISVTRVGQSVNKDMKIGTMGSTGSWSGGYTHLHFEVRTSRYLNQIDPAPVEARSYDRDGSINPPGGGEKSCGECFCEEAGGCDSDNLTCDHGGSSGCDVGSSGVASRCVIKCPSGKVADSTWCGCKSVSIPTPTPTSTPIPIDPAKGDYKTLTCQSTTGWACDPSDYGSKIKVKLYRSDPVYPNDISKKALLATVTANQSGTSDCGGTAGHNFQYTIPQWIFDQHGGNDMKIWAYAVTIGGGSEKIMTNSPRVINTNTCTVVTNTSTPTPTLDPVITNTPTITPTPIPTGSITCGPLDSYNANGEPNGDGLIDLKDFIRFRQVYGRSCNDDDINYGMCGGNNRRYQADDNIVNLSDFIHLAKVYGKDSCIQDTNLASLPETGVAESNINYIAIIFVEIIAAIVILFGAFNYKKYKDE